MNIKNLCPNLIIGILFGVINLYSCTNDLDEVEKLTSRVQPTKDIGENVKIIYSDSAQVRLILESPILEKFNSHSESKEVYKGGVKISFLNRNKEVTAWLTADEVIREPRQNRLKAVGNVVIENTAMDKMQTSEIIYEEGTKKIYSNKFIRITRPSKADTIYGLGFMTDREFKRFEIKKRVKGKMSPDYLIKP